MLMKNVALISVSSPDKHGYCSLGVSVDTTLAAVENAEIVIAQINRFMPRTHGDGTIHISRIHFAVEKDQALPEIEQAKIGEIEQLEFRCVRSTNNEAPVERKLHSGQLWTYR